MTALRGRFAGSLILVLHFGWLGCDRPPGEPQQDPSDPTAFALVWGMHCSGCHGADGALGPARNFEDPVYWALVTDEIVGEHIRMGVAGTAMPAFGALEGGPLREPEIASLVAEMRKRWSTPDHMIAAALPAYRGAEGSPDRGRAVFDRNCASCHGSEGSGGAGGGSIVERSYLRLASRQALRLAVVCGRSDLGMPDWRNAGPRAMTEREIDDVVAWLWAQREPALAARSE